jgi:metallophosphoesterase (TIGR00282 family)
MKGEGDSMRILAIGDIVASFGSDFVCHNLEKIKEKYNIDFCVANGENACTRNGISTAIAGNFFRAGADVITLGNHAFSNDGVFKILKEDCRIIRPINYPPGTVGSGYVIAEVGDIKILVINAMGRVFMRNQLDCPFRVIEKLLAKVEGSYDISILDFHAEATSEKIAIANYFDGRINIVFGTHTHVQTADDHVLPGGTAFMCDLGMTGAHDSVIGVKKEVIIKSFITSMYQRHENAEGDIRLDGAIFDIDTSSKRINSIERLSLDENL